MPDLYLLIPDPALAGAVAEQLKLGAVGTVNDSGALPESPPETPTAILLDEAACNARNVKKLRGVKNDRLLVFLLGAPPEEIEESLITEIFPKPFRLGHLLARLNFHLDVAPRLRSAPIPIGPWRLEAQQRSLVRGDEAIRLTEKETALLEYLAQSPAPVGREELLAAVWGYDARIDTHTLETHVYQLRRKLGGEWIVNEDGLYRLAR